MTAPKNSRGFTLIELLIVIIVIGILGTLVAMTYNGVQAKNRNSQRQADINTLQSNLETYFAQTSKYPSLANLNDNTWRSQNLKDLPTNTIQDPRWTKTGPCAAGGKAVLIAAPTANCYTYQVTTAEGGPCDNDKNACAQYTLTALLEGGEKYVKSSLN